jgi:hypothetical protein
VRHAGAVAGTETTWVYLVGGAGGLLSSGPAYSYASGQTEIPASQIAQRIAADAGETLADGVVAELESIPLHRWHRASGITAAAALDLLAEDSGRVWRVLPSGRLWIGVETWPATTAAVTYLTEDIADGSTHYAIDGASLAAGAAVGSARAVEVAYTVSPSSLRVGVRAELSGDPPHRADRALYARSWPATVVARHADRTLDLRADDARIGDLLSVPWVSGLPGCRVEVQEGARVRVRFAGASPAGAYVCDSDEDASATAALALVGDGCSYLSGTVAAAPGPVTFVVSSTPTGAPGEVQIVVVGPGHRDVRGVSA